MNISFLLFTINIFRFYISIISTFILFPSISIRTVYIPRTNLSPIWVFKYFSYLIPINIWIRIIVWWCTWFCIFLVIIVIIWNSYLCSSFFSSTWITWLCCSFFISTYSIWLCSRCFSIIYIIYYISFFFFDIYIFCNFFFNCFIFITYFCF